MLLRQISLSAFYGALKVFPFMVRVECYTYDGFLYPPLHGAYKVRPFMALKWKH